MAFQLDDEPVAAAPVSGGFKLDDAPAPTIGVGKRILHGMYDPIEGGAQLLYNALPTDVVNTVNKANNFLAQYGLVAPISEGGLNADIRSREATYQTLRGSDQGSTDWARIGGNLLSPMNLALGGTAAPASVMGAIGTSAGLGAASSLLTPSFAKDSDIAGEKLTNAGIGALTGGTVGGFGAIGSALLSPAASRNASLQLLRNENVRPTIGQALGGGWNRAEESLTSTPIAGDFIANARQRAADTFRQAAYNRVTNPLGVRPTGLLGHEAVNELQDATSDAYSSAAQRLGAFQLDQPAVTAMQRVHGMTQYLPDEQQRVFQGTMNQLDQHISPTGFIQGEGFKDVDSILGTAARNYRNSASPSDRQLGDAYREMQQQIRQSMGRQAPPGVAADFQAADQAYANQVRVEGAATRAAASGGNLLMQDLGTAGQDVIGNKVPNSGTASRLMTPAAIMAAFTNPKVLASTIAAPILYSSPVQRGLVAAVTARPQWAQRVAPLLLRGSSMAAPTAAQTATGLLNY